jgi:hypothetical protein
MQKHEAGGAEDSEEDSPIDSEKQLHESFEGTISNG